MKTPRQLLKLFLLAATAFVFTQCGSDDPAPKAKPDEPTPAPVPIAEPADVYVAGRYNNGTTNVPAYWKNGELVELSETTGEAQTIAVLGENVYVIGYIEDGTGKKRLWTNGVMTEFSGGTVNTGIYVYTMRVFGNDWYVAGMVSDNTGDHATIWKNGVKTTLCPDYDSRAIDIAVDGEDVYAVGFERHEAIAVATYWKNGEPNYLTDGTVSADAEGIVINNGDIYISGNENGYAKAWKNEIALTLNDAQNAYTAQGSIAVVDNKVYVLGYQTMGNNNTAVYWKDGILVPLQVPEGADNIYGYTIESKDSDIFFLGEGRVGDIYRALVWKNFELVAPFDGTEVSTGYGISVNH